MQISPAIHAIRHPFKVPVAPGISLDRFVYSYIICGKTITLIDTGVAGCEKQIFDTIRSIHRSPSEIALMVLTHSHPDHIGAARAIQAATNCRIAAHPAERPWIEDVELQNRERPVPGFSTLVGESVRLDCELTEGGSIHSEDPQVGDLRVLYTPGHSPGSISLFLPDEGVLFSGDAVPVTAGLPIYDDALASVRSIKRLMSLPGIRILLSAWDEPKTGEEVYLQMDRAIRYLQEIHEAVRANAGEGPADLIELTRKTTAALGLPPQAATPMLARTFAANLAVRDRVNLLSDSP